MELAKHWKIVGATAAVAGLGLGGVLGAAADDRESSGAGAIALREAAAVADVAPPAPVAAPSDDGQGSPDGESFDSPLQSADDSPEGQDSLDSPGGSPGGESVDSPAASADDSAGGQDSLDSPEPVVAPAPPPPPPPPAAAPAPARAPDRADSPDGASVDSPS
jgi:hypothetical protein